MTAADHDGAVALTSHLPHLMAHALIHSARRRPAQKILKVLMAGSFRDVTRVACADATQWAAIFAANGPALRRATQEFARQMERLSAHVGRPAMRLALRRSQSYRQPLFHGL